jgi:hypothetical protein
MAHVPPGGPPNRARRTNRLAVVALVTGLLGLILLAVGFAIAALVQIGRRGERGKGLAIGGLVAGVAWLTALVALAIAALTGAVGEGIGGSAALKLFPQPGQCFDIPKDERSAEFPLAACDAPHDAEMILYFKLPKGEWPGQQEIDRLGEAGCEQRLTARFKTRTPVLNGVGYSLHPTRVSWSIGDRAVHCAIADGDGGKLTRPVGRGPSQNRDSDELRRGDCYNEPKKALNTVTLIPCDKPHKSQLTHRFELPAGAYPGDAEIGDKASDGCNARWDKMFGEKENRFEEFYWHPSQESWAEGDRLVLCYVSGAKGGDLTRSVIPR